MTEKTAFIKECADNITSAVKRCTGWDAFYFVMTRVCGDVMMDASDHKCNDPLCHYREVAVVISYSFLCAHQIARGGAENRFDVFVPMFHKSFDLLISKAVQAYGVDNAVTH